MRYATQTWSPGKVLDFDMACELYTVQLGLTGNKVQVPISQVRSFSDESLLLRRRASTSKGRLRHGELHTTSRSRARVLLQPPERDELTNMQLEIKAISHMLQLLLARGWHTWYSFREQRLRKSGLSGTAASVHKLIGWGSSRGRKPSTNASALANFATLKTSLDATHAATPEEVEAKRVELKRVAAREYEVSRAGADGAWATGRFEECVHFLDVCVKNKYESGMLHNFRGRAHDKIGSAHAALQDAYRAVELSPNTSNHLLLGRFLQQSMRLDEAGTEYMAAGNSGGGTLAQMRVDNNATGLFKAIRRNRGYFNGRPPPIPKIIDDEGGMASLRPDPPELALQAFSSSDFASMVARWMPIENNEDPMSFIEYELQYSGKRLIFDGSTKLFVGQFEPWEPVNFKMRAADQSNLLKAGTRGRGSVAFGAAVKVRARDPARALSSAPSSRLALGPTAALILPHAWLSLCPGR